ncbi:tripartite tricarboxylate transporter TctB family protein [Paracoccus litorisediminis]|jgi:putative tricarboxylic transport membrane protein|uniref:Tripartite tricarboxylate transporter TctB family protein n=1 Tax=Paracoccus litorisediminis TaxID=2006130 RepID=A0A844HL79_9RHOB|nr:tripartite tricarboxylate transporter TctB family protein [Paracoccus litorisediminis]MTH59137.1 tripartite tricarboxylate transporter TctB family protein [Paracoccus litorisediminis]
MRLGDRALGALTLLGAIGLFFASRQFSPIPGQKYGAETLPLVISILAGAVGIWLLVQGLATERGAALTTTPDWAREPAAWAKIMAAIIVIAGYILVSDWLGFTISSLILVAALMLLTGTRLLTALPVALATVIVVQFAFGKLLLVPLPRGEFLSLPW